MPAEQKKNQYKAIQSLFLTGQVKRMRDIEYLYPTKLSKDLKINHSRYIAKLHKPEEFTFKHIWNMGKLLDIDMQLIIEVIKTELNQQSKQPKKKSS